MEQTDTLDLFKIAEIELVYRRPASAGKRPVIKEAATAYEILKSAWDMNRIDLQEEFKILLLNRGNFCLGISHVATGGISACIADSRLIFATALKANASSIILAHNHPSGNLDASSADIELTREMIQAGKLLRINIYDHLILSSQGYRSLANEGLMPC